MLGRAALALIPLVAGNAWADNIERNPLPRDCADPVPEKFAGKLGIGLAEATPI